MEWSGRSKDCHGHPVRIGMHVRLLKLPVELKKDLSAEEWLDIESMLGGVFEVTEIGEYGHPYIEKWCQRADGSSHFHCLWLHPDEMEVVSDSTGSG